MEKSIQMFSYVNKKHILQHKLKNARIIKNDQINKMLLTT